MEKLTVGCDLTGKRAPDDGYLIEVPLYKLHSECFCELLCAFLIQTSLTFSPPLNPVKIDIQIRDY